jgi:type I restriction enzyme S subunit
VNKTRTEQPEYRKLRELVGEDRPITYGILKPGPDMEDGVPYVRVVDMQDGTVRVDQVRRTSEGIAQQYARSTLKEGDILLSIRGHVGRVATVPRTLEGANITQDTARIAMNGRCCPRYLFWFLQTPAIQQWMQRHTKGVAVKGINLGDVKELEVPLPSGPTQARIAAILDKADAIRHKRAEGIRLTEEMLRSTFMEMFGDPVANERGWPRKPLSEVLDNIDSGWSPKCHDRRAEGDEWAILKLGAVTYCKYQPEENKALPDSEQPQPDLEVKAGDLLMTRKNTYDLVAACAFVFETPPKLMLPDLIFRLRIKDKAPVRAEYLWGLFTHPGKRRGIQSLAGGSAGSMPNISKAKLLGQPIELPPAPLQDSFAEFMHGHHRMKKRRLELIADQDSLFAALVQQAFRGELTNGKDA